MRFDKIHLMTISLDITFLLSSLIMVVLFLAHIKRANSPEVISLALIRAMTHINSLNSP